LNNITASTIICTYNRSDFLTELLDKLLQQDFPKDQYEIIIVDNASTDKTYAIVEALIKNNSDFNIRYVYEENQGLSFARNRGIQESRGQYIIYIDDDELPKNRDWLRNLIAVFDTHQADAVGGTIELDFRAKPPYWLTKSFHGWLGEFPAAQDEPYQTFSTINGGNMAFRKSVLLELDGFNQNLGRKGKHLLAGEDTDLSHRLTEKDKTIFIAPNAIMNHIIESNRLTKSYFIRLQKGIIFPDYNHQFSFQKRFILIIKSIAEIIINGIIFILCIISMRFWFFAYLYLYRSWIKLRTLASTAPFR
jgi:glucosyl-dolichyl phosphate glucuronosyltransferase